MLISLNSETARKRALEALQAAPLDWVMELRQETRSSQQNRFMWALLNDVAKQKTWCGEKLTAEEWKDLFTALLKGQRATQGLEGGIVFLGARTSKMSKEELSDLIITIEAWGAENEVQFSE
jgi:hypothetical protein